VVHDLWSEATAMSGKARGEFAISDDAVEGKIVTDPYNERGIAVANDEVRVGDAAVERLRAHRRVPAGQPSSDIERRVS
jgi:hypothetical protein